MRRGSDRLQAVIRAGLLAAFLAGAPVAAFYAGHGVYASGLRTAQAQAACHRVPAAIVAVTPVSTGWGPRAGPPRGLLSVRWAAPGGPWRTGEAVRPKKAETGTTTVVCIGRDGGLAGPPLARDQVTGRPSLPQLRWWRLWPCCWLPRPGVLLRPGQAPACLLGG